MDVSNNASNYIKEKLKIKVAKWGLPKTYLKKQSLKKTIWLTHAMFVLQKKIEQMLKGLCQDHMLPICYQCLEFLNCFSLIIMIFFQTLHKICNIIKRGNKDW
jgi:hypothetical protein